MEVLGNALGIIYIIATLAIGTAVFIKRRYIYFGDVATGMFSAWLGCVVGTGFVLGLIFWFAAEMVSAVVSFILNYWMGILGVLILLIGICIWLGLFEPAETENHQEDTAEAKKPKRMGIIVCCIGLLLFGFGTFGHSKTEPPNNAVSSEVSNTMSQTSKAARPTKAIVTKPSAEATGKIDNPTAVKAEGILQQYQIEGKVVATSLSGNPQGFISIVKKENQYTFVLFDQINNQLALVPFSEPPYNFTQQKNALVVFDLIILKDRHDNDEKYGVWKGKNHMMPIYALYKLDANGNVIPGMLTTGVGERPSNYQSYLNEKKNVDIANLFLTEMKALQENVRANNVSLSRQ